MKRSKYTDEQILAIVKEGEAGRKVADLCRTHGITDQTYYRWKAKYGGMELSEMQRLKQIEDENRRLKQIVADQTLDIQALKAVVAKSGRPHRSARGGGVASEARHKSAPSLSGDRTQHGDVALSAADERNQRHRPGTPPGPRGGTRSIWLSAAAYSPRA
jgi:putative transposase